MSRAERLRRWNARRATGDAGFTLIEVLVALVIFAMVVSAAIGMLIAASRASLVAKMDTGAKSLTQERVEQLRNLPFHIDHNLPVNTVETDDLLDTYYKTYSATNAACQTTGFVHGGTATTASSPAAGSVRCTYYGDPAAGDFYRVVANPVTGYPRYKQFITTQFLGPSGAAGVAYDVPTTYNTQGDPATADLPPSTLAGVRVTTLWTVGKLSKKNSVFTLVAQGRPAATSAAFSAQASALSVFGRVDSSTALTSQAGLLNLEGTATRNTVASVSAQGVFAGLDPGDRLNGACALASSSGSLTACTNPQTNGASLLDALSNVQAAFGNSIATGATQSTTSSLPKVGTSDASGNPTGLVIGSVDGTGNAPNISGQTIYGVNTVAPNPGGFRGSPSLQLNTGKPLVYIDRSSAGSQTLCGNAANPAITGLSVATGAAMSAGYGTTIGGTGHFASTCVASQVQGLRLFPTNYAPTGIVLIDFSSQVTCRTNGGSYVSGTNSNGGKGYAGYSGTVRVWNNVTSTYGSAISFSASTPLSSAVPLTTVVGPGGLMLSNYISSWGSASTADLAAGIVVDQDSNAVTLNYDNLARVSSVLLNSTDPNSSFGVLLGNASCRAEDNR